MVENAVFPPVPLRAVHEVNQVSSVAVQPTSTINHDTGVNRAANDDKPGWMMHLGL